MKYLKLFEDVEFDPFGEEDWSEKESKLLCYLVFRDRRGYSKSRYYISEYYNNDQILILDNDYEFNLNQKTYINGIGDEIIQKLTINEKQVDNIKNDKIPITRFYNEKTSFSRIKDFVRKDVPIVFLTKENKDEYGGQNSRVTNWTGPR